MSNSRITQLDENVIRSYVRLDTGKGYALRKSIENLSSLCTRAGTDIFGADDQSSAHEAMDYLSERIAEIRTILDNYDTRIDNLVSLIQTDILDAEDTAASNIRREI